MNESLLAEPSIAAFVATSLNENAVSLQPLAHGQNNQIFKVQLSDRFVVVKRYFEHPLDRRDRLAHEWSFMSYLWRQGLRCIPEPLAVDKVANLACYSFIAGAPFTGPVSEKDVSAAGDFYAKCNLARESDEARALPMGAEASFSIAGHLSLLRGRVDSLTKQEPPDDLRSGYFELVRQLQVLTDAYEKWIQQRDPHWDSVLPRNLHFLSASDFGFHNCIRGESGELFFLDFEYAGWDDPGRAVCDVFLQPRIQVPEDFKAIFLNNAFPHPSIQAMVRERADLMLPLIGLRWCCILLNVFCRVGVQRRQFAGQRPSREILERQLKLACTRALALESLIHAT